MFTEINKFFISNIAPTHTVFYRGDKKVSFAEFSDDVARMANVFNRIKSDTVILYIPENIYLFHVMFMALMQAKKDVILPAILTEQSIDALRTETDTIVSDQMINFAGFTSVDINQDFGSDWNFCDMDDRLIYFFTSGSTGTPKKICKTFHNLSAEVAMHNKMQYNAFNMSPVTIASIAPYHMYGLLWRFLIPMAGGIAIDTNMIFTPEELQDAQQKFDAVLFATTPSFLDGIVKYQGQYKFPDNCVGIFSSGSLLNLQTSEKTRKIFGVSPFEVFGSTETGGVAFRQQENGPLWTVFDGVKINSDENNCIIADSEFCCVRPFQMSDVIESQNEHQFVLKGRADRIVKIAEERISLPEYEDRLCSHKFVEHAYVTTVNQNGRVVIGCVLTLTDEGKNFITSHGRHEFITNIKNLLSAYFPNVALPRKIRIVNKIPMNTQGKILKLEINEILRSIVAEPIAKKLTTTDSFLTAELMFLGDSAYFKGHFEDCPVLPGVIQLHFVIKFIQTFFHKKIEVYDVIKLKFTSLILPDTLVHFQLNKLSDNEFSFCYEKGDVKYSAGKIVIKE
ncbi:MAG: acyl-CoA synthetase [Alphaproteobacteria bacterium]|nr:acyl-CoA synthetase [Alphaproteobacteria bacterium]